MDTVLDSEYKSPMKTLEEFYGVSSLKLLVKYYFIALKQHLLPKCQNFGSKKLWPNNFFFGMRTERAYFVEKFAVDIFIFIDYMLL